MKKLILIAALVWGALSSHVHAWQIEKIGIVEGCFTGTVSIVSNNLMGVEMPCQSYVIQLPDGRIGLGCVGGKGWGDKKWSQYVGKEIVLTGRFRHTIFQGVLQSYKMFGAPVIEEVVQ